MIFIFFILIFGLIPSFAIASEPIYLQNADELIGEHHENINTRVLKGNVIIQQKNVTAYCNYAVQYITQNRFEMKGNVVIKQDSLVLNSDFIIYDGNTYLATTNVGVTITDGKRKLIGDRGSYSTQTLIADFHDNVTMFDDTMTIIADNVVYYRKSGESIAKNNVVIKSNQQNTFLQADLVKNYPETNTTIATNNAVLFQIDTIKNNNIDSADMADTSQLQTLQFDTLSICSDTMIAHRTARDSTFSRIERDRYVFINNVEIVRNTLKATARLGLYNTADSQIVLYCPALTVETDSVPTTKPDSIHTVVWLDSTQLHADSVMIKLEQNKVSQILAFRNCISVSVTDSTKPARIDQLAGNTIQIDIKDDTLRQIKSTGDAKAVFFTDNEEELSDGLIESQAEEIIIDIEEGQASNVTLIKEIPGKYHPEPLIHNKEQEFYLPNFIKLDIAPVQPVIRNRQPAKSKI